MSNNNPLLQIYETFWDMLEDSTHFTDLVLPGNRVKYHETPNEKDTLSAPADFPQVAVVPVQTDNAAFSDSSGSGISITWSIRVLSGERKLESILDVQWAVIRALANWQQRMMNLTWEADEFVKSCRALKTNHDIDNKLQNRGTRGWSDIWTGETQCWFRTFDLQI